MHSDDFPDPLGARARWAVRESGVVLAIVLFWLAVGVALLFVVGLLQLLVRTLGLTPLGFVFAFADDGEAIWALLTPLASATTALYVLVRAGTILIDRYRTA